VSAALALEGIVKTWEDGTAALSAFSLTVSEASSSPCSARPGRASRRRCASSRGWRRRTPAA
jgi:hypothetical protein